MRAPEKYNIPKVNWLKNPNFSFCKYHNRLEELEEEDKGEKMEVHDEGVVEEAVEGQWADRGRWPGWSGCGGRQGWWEREDGDQDGVDVEEDKGDERQDGNQDGVDVEEDKGDEDRERHWTPDPTVAPHFNGED